LKKKAASSISPFEKSSRCRIECRKRTHGIVGAVIYLSLPKSDENIRQRIITQAVIAEAAGVSEVPIRMYTKKLKRSFH